MYLRIIGLTLLTCFASAQLHAQLRLSNSGEISHEAFGLPKWQSRQSVQNNAARGDLVVLRTTLEPNESQTVGVYLYAQPANDNFEPVGETHPVAVNRLARQWGYESKTLGSLGSWLMFRNTTANEQKEVPVQLFVPYNAIGLESGNYLFKYEFRVWVNDSLVDRYFADYSWPCAVGPGNVVTRLTECAAGTAFLPFELTSDSDPNMIGNR